MDTNLVNQLVSILSQKQQSLGYNPQIMAMFGILLAQVVVSIAGYIQARTAAINAGLTAVSAAKQADSLEKVHVAVNNERSVMQKELELKNVENLRLSKELAVFGEFERNRKAAEFTPVSSGLTKADLVEALRTVMAEARK